VAASGPATQRGGRSPSGGPCLTQQAGRSQSHASDCLLEAPADADTFGVPAEESIREVSHDVLSQELIFAQEGQFLSLRRETLTFLVVGPAQ